VAHDRFVLGSFQVGRFFFGSSRGLLLHDPTVTPAASRRAGSAVARVLFLLPTELPHR
jgi:hypothetical protein